MTDLSDDCISPTKLPARSDYADLLDHGLTEATVEHWLATGWTLDQLRELNRAAGF